MLRVLGTLGQWPFSAEGLSGSLKRARSCSSARPVSPSSPLRHRVLWVTLARIWIIGVVTHAVTRQAIRLSRTFRPGHQMWMTEARGLKIEQVLVWFDSHSDEVSKISHRISARSEVSTSSGRPRIGDDSGAGFKDSENAVHKKMKNGTSAGVESLTSVIDKNKPHRFDGVKNYQSGVLRGSLPFASSVSGAQALNWASANSQDRVRSSARPVHSVHKWIGRASILTSSDKAHKDRVKNLLGQPFCPDFRPQTPRSKQCSCVKLNYFNRQDRMIMNNETPRLSQCRGVESGGLSVRASPVSGRPKL